MPTSEFPLQRMLVSPKGYETYPADRENTGHVVAVGTELGKEPAEVPLITDEIVVLWDGAL